MKEFEKCLLIKRALIRRAGECIAYTTWTDEYCVKQLRSIHKELGEKINCVDISKLTSKELDEIGFGKWSENSPLRLIPLFLLPYLPDQIDVGSIDGEEPCLINKKDMDDDNRGGYLAYGIVPKDI